MSHTANQIVQAMYDRQVLVFGHRGAKSYAPMNTLPAFELAVAQGAHGIELDVHRSKDGHPVIVHDFEVDETSDGAGLVTHMQLAELKALDAGSWFAPEFAGVRIPTLDEVFEAVGKRVFVNVEIKSESIYTDGVEKVVADCIARHDMAHRVIVSSFNPLTLKRFRALQPDTPIAYLTFPGVPLDVNAIAADLIYEAFHPYFQMIDSEMVEAQTAAGRVINTWTVNDPADAVRLRDLGVRGIVTDSPDVMLQALGLQS